MRSGAGAGLLVGMALVGCASQGTAGGPAEPVTSEMQTLGTEIMRQDSALSAAFNAHDLDALMALFSEDLEFFHDQEGLQSWDDVSRGFSSLFAKDDGIHRALLSGGGAVYPIPGFGALQVGAHRFCHVEGPDEICGEFDFSHVWKKSGDDWQIARALSYGHLGA